MRVKKRQPDFGDISRRSIKKDFNRRKTPEQKFKKDFQEAPRNGEAKRIIFVNETCSYAKYARFIVGKLVRCVESKGKGTTTGWYEFVHDDDRRALNAAAMWSNNKNRYFLERPKFKN